MDAESLIGKRLGGCVLQRVLGQGTMGAVYLAQQSYPARQVAVKVFLRASSLELLQQIEFLQHFRKEIDLATSLEHPHIVAVYEYGDYDGMAYLIMPCISGETLEDLLAREKRLSLAETLHYLEQIAAALDYAHARGMVHRDLKPANIFVTAEKRVLVADFNVTAMLSEGSTARMRLSRPGMLDYMAPELVLGKEVDARADLYALGAILFRMLTGAPLFQGQTLMKVATKHLKSLPPSPRTLRPDLPVAAEQAILAALAKNPAERYTSARDVVLVFRQSLTGVQSAATFAPQVAAPPPVPPPSQPALPTSVPRNPAPVEQTGTGSMSRLFAPGSLLGPAWRTSSLAAVQQNQGRTQATDAWASLSSESALANTGDFSSTDALAIQSQGTASQNTTASRSIIAPVNQPVTPVESTAPLQAAQQGNVTRALPLPQGNVTRLLPLQAEQNTGATGTFKLTSPVKIVSIPVAGQPGQYVTKILPTLPDAPTTSGQTAAMPAPAKRPATKKIGIVLLIALALIGSLTFWRLQTSAPKTGSPARQSALSAPNLNASATANALATQQANIIVDDPLSQNIRNWPVATSGKALYQFKDGAYHITDNDPNNIAPAILAGENLDQPFVYSLTMEEIRGNDTSVNNEFGMILRFNAQQKNGKQLVTFYTFEVLNKQGGEYQFWKYDNTQDASNPWKELQHHSFGGEFHQGQGPKSINTFKIQANGKTFTLIVNGKQVWTVQDSSFRSGGVGMLVNLNGTEVAFSHLLLTNS